MFKKIIFGLFVAGALLAPQAPASANPYYRLRRGPVHYNRPVYAGNRFYYGRPRVYPRPYYYGPRVTVAPYNYGYPVVPYNQNGAYLQFGY